MNENRTYSKEMLVIFLDGTIHNTFECGSHGNVLKNFKIQLDTNSIYFWKAIKF